MKGITKLSSKFWRNVEKEQATIQRVQKGHKRDDIWSSGVQSNSAGQRGGKGISNKRSPLQSTEVCAWGMVWTAELEGDWIRLGGGYPEERYYRMSLEKRPARAVGGLQGRWRSHTCHVWAAEHLRYFPAGNHRRTVLLDGNSVTHVVIEGNKGPKI